MIKLYYHPSPNPAKVALFLEEAGLQYEVVSIDMRKGEQFEPAFLAINPNAKTPALTDGEAKLFDSTAILLYLARKTSMFLSEDTDSARAEMLLWLMLVATGIGPYSGQAVHFKHFAPEPKDYAVNRQVYEAERYWGLIDKKLEGSRDMVGDRYTIVDISVWGQGQAVPFILSQEAWAQFPNVKRLMDEVITRPAAERAAALAAKYVFKTEMDEAARAGMLPQNKRLAAA